MIATKVVVEGTEVFPSPVTHRPFVYLSCVPMSERCDTPAANCENILLFI